MISTNGILEASPALDGIMGHSVLSCITKYDRILEIRLLSGPACTFDGLIIY
jgi:hypothetical protein